MLASVIDGTTGEYIRYQYGPAVGRWMEETQNDTTYFLGPLEFRSEGAYNLHVDIPGGVMCTLRVGSNEDSDCSFTDGKNIVAL